MRNTLLILLFLSFLTSTVFAGNLKIGYVENPEVLLGDRESICTISFAANTSELSPEARQILTQNVKRIKQIDLDEKMVRLEGFASPEGNREQNFRLSIDRARAVERFLRTNHGVSLDNYITGFGPTAPKGLSAAGKRYVQIVVYDNPWGKADIPLEVTGSPE